MKVGRKSFVVKSHVSLNEANKRVRRISKSESRTLMRVSYSLNQKQFSRAITEPLEKFKIFWYEV